MVKSVILAIVLVLILLFSVLYLTHSVRPVLVSNQTFIEECGYKMPKLYSEVKVRTLGPKTTKVLSAGFRKNGGDQVYIKVDSPFINFFEPILTVKCKNIETL